MRVNILLIYPEYPKRHEVYATFGGGQGKQRAEQETPEVKEDTCHKNCGESCLQPHGTTGPCPGTDSMTDDTSPSTEDLLL